MTVRALNSVAPMVTVNLQDIWSQTLRPLQAHGNTLVTLGSNIIVVTERIDELKGLYETHEQFTSKTFKQQDTRMDKLEQNISTTAARLEQMNDWKTEVLAALHKETREREEYQLMQHQRMEEMETQLRDRTNDALQKLENIEHNLNKEASRRQDHEQVFFEQKMVWEDKIQQMVNRQEEVVDRVEGARLVTERLASAVDAAATAQTRMALQIVELENREIPENIRKLPAEVELMNDQFPTISSKLDMLFQHKDTMSVDIEVMSTNLAKGFERVEKNLEVSVQDAKAGAQDVGERVRNELYSKMDSFNTSMRENMQEMTESRKREMDDFQGRLKYLVSPADVAEMIQRFDPLANRDPLPEKPVSVADVRAMFDSQRTQKSAIMRGMGVSNCSELMEAFLLLQKQLLELTSESQDLETKVYSIEKTLRKDVFEMVDEIIKGLETKMNQQSKHSPQHSRPTSGVSSGTPPTPEHLGAGEKKDLDKLKQKFRKFEERMDGLGEIEHQVETLSKLVNQLKEEQSHSGERTQKKDLSIEMQTTMNELHKLQADVKTKMDVDKIDELKREMMHDCMEQIRLNSVKLNLSKDDMSAIGPIKAMLEDVIDRMHTQSQVVGEVKSAVVEKADAKLVQLMNEEITNIRHIFDVREDAVRTDMHHNHTALKADLGLKLDEPRTRSVVEQMLSMFQNQFVPKDGSTASVPMDPVEIGDEYKRRVDEVQSQLKSLQEQIIAVDTAVEKQSYAQTEVVNMQLKRVITELDAFRNLLDEYKKSLNGKASAKKVMELDSLLRELANHWLSGDNSTQVLLASKLGEAWRCLSCNKSPVGITDVVGQPIHNTAFAPSPPRLRAQSPQHGFRPNTLAQQDHFRSDSAMDRPYSPSRGVDLQQVKGQPRVQSPTVGAQAVSHQLMDGQFRSQSAMPPMNFLSKSRDISGEITRTGRPASPATGLAPVRAPTSRSSISGTRRLPTSQQ